MSEPIPTESARLREQCERSFIAGLEQQLQTEHAAREQAEAQINEAAGILKTELDRDDDPKDTLRILVVVAVNSLARLKSERDVLKLKLEAAKEAHSCFEAAIVEGWCEALAGCDSERLRDIWMRRLNFAREALAQLNSAVDCRVEAGKDMSSVAICQGTDTKGIIQPAPELNAFSFKIKAP